MMKTAVCLTLGTCAFADYRAAAFLGYSNTNTDLRASSLIGMRAYSAGKGIERDPLFFKGTSEILTGAHDYDVSEKPAAATFDELTIVHSSSDGDVLAFMDTLQEALKAQATYEK